MAVSTHQHAPVGPLRGREIVKAAAPSVAAALADVEAGADELVLHSLELNTQAAQLLGRTLLHSKIATLLIPNCNIRDVGVEYVGMALADAGCRLTWIDVSANGVTQLSRRFLAGVGGSGRLLGLNVAQNPLKRGALAALCEAVGGSACRVEHLDVTGTGAFYGPAELACAARRVATLRCGSNACWYPPEAAAFVRAVQAPAGPVGLRALDLTSSCLTTADAPLLTELMRVLPNLERLCLRHNDIDSKGLVALCDGFRAAPKLTHVNVSSNPLGGIRLPRAGVYDEKGLLALATAMEDLKTLEHIDLSRCCLGLGNNPFYDGGDHGGVGYLVDAVKRNVYMKTVNLSANRFTAATIRRLRTLARGKGVFDDELETDTAVVFAPSSQINYAAYTNDEAPARLK